MGKRKEELPAEVLAVRVEIETWRSTRAKRCAMPGSLWIAATDLARRYGVYRISKELRLNYEGLKRRVLCSAHGEGLTSGGEGDGDSADAVNDVDNRGQFNFVEVRGVGSSYTGGICPGQIEVEVYDGQGAKMSVRLSDGGRVDFGALIDSFWSRVQ